MPTNLYELISLKSLEERLAFLKAIQGAVRGTLYGDAYNVPAITKEYLARDYESAADAPDKLLAELVLDAAIKSDMKNCQAIITGKTEVEERDKLIEDLLAACEAIVAADQAGDFNMLATATELARTAIAKAKEGANAAT